MVTQFCFPFKYEKIIFVWEKERNICVSILQVDESVAEHAEERKKIPVVCCVALIFGIILTLAITLPVVFV
jgi:hypothetical protein